MLLDELLDRLLDYIVVDALDVLLEEPHIQVVSHIKLNLADLFIPEDQ